MRILLDECVPARLKRSLAEHEVTTVPRQGWSGIKNGDLLALAEKEFDVFITVDRNLSEQQHLPGFQIAIILFVRRPIDLRTSAHSRRQYRRNSLMRPQER